MSTSRTFTVVAPDGVLLAAQEHLPEDLADDTPTVVLAHGWTLTHASWRPVVERLVARSLRVVTYDQRGHGCSSALPARPTVRMLGDDLAAVLDVVSPGAPVVLGGHSMGGMTVMAYAGLHADELPARVRGVVLVATSSGDLRSALRPVENAAMRLAARMPRVPAGRFVTTAGQRHLLFGADAVPEQVREVRDLVAATTLPTMGQFFAALGEHDEAQALAALDGIPIVVLVGERDRLTPPRHAHRIGELAPSATVVELPGRGHMLAYEATDEVADAFASVLAAQSQAG